MTQPMVLCVVPHDIHYHGLTNIQVSFMNTMTRWGGLEALGIMYSLPFALLIWAYVLTAILPELTDLTKLQDDFLSVGVILHHFRIE